MSVRLRNALSGVAFACASLSANAGLIIADPDAFAAGTNISNAFAGVTLSGPGQANTSVFSLANAGLSTTGNNIFGSGDDGLEWGDGFNAGMRIAFAAPTNFVSIDIIGNDGSDNGRLLVYDSANNLLQTFQTGTLSTGQFQTASILRATSDIAYAIATGSANGVDSISLDNLQYNVPEPGTLALLGLGLAGLAATRRRKQ